MDDLEHSLMKEKNRSSRVFFFVFLCFAIPDLDLGVLKMLTRVRFCDVLQPEVY